jgi:Protein of unknown function (DUF3822)
MFKEFTDTFFLLLHVYSYYMVKKTAGIYGNIAVQSPFNTDQLVIEVSKYHIACLVKLAIKNQLVALELYTFDSTENDWYEIFQQVRSKSRVLDRGFIDTKVYLNLPETILIPKEKFSQEAAINYIELLFGDAVLDVVKTDSTNFDVIIASKVNRSLIETVNSNLMMISIKNTYSSVINNVLNPSRPYNHTLLKVQVYGNQILLVLTHNNQLLATQLYHILSNEDVLYYLLNALQQFNLKTDETTLELSGAIEIKSALIDNLKKVFSKITYDNIKDDIIFSDDFNKQPKHFYTPYLNLMN